MYPGPSPPPSTAVAAAWRILFGSGMFSLATGIYIGVSSCELRWGLGGKEEEEADQ